jgi:cytochrome c-type biogenesis protein CcmH/NrfG
MALGEPMDAIRALRQAIRLQPDFSEAHARLELAEAFTLNQGLLPEETAIILDLLFRKE